MPKGKILLSHGSGGRLTHDLIKGLLLDKLNNKVLKELGDSARLNYRQPLAFTTDSFVVSPLFFPGGDIGSLCVCGTINDLVMLGAKPEYLSLSFIIEEGLEYKTLEKIVSSIASEARKAGVSVVTGDLKVVEKGAADKIFINTSGVGRIINNVRLSPSNIEPQDKIIVTGSIGEHGLAVLAKRKALDLDFNIQSDCAALHNLLLPLLKNERSVKFMRDPTRGGIATTLNEITEASGLGIIIDESKIPVSKKVKVACELLGIDPLYSACEGRAVLVVAKNKAKEILRLLQRQKLGKHAREIGEVSKEHRKKVVLNTVFDTQRIIDMLTGEQLPRIC